MFYSICENLYSRTKRLNFLRSVYFSPLSTFFLCSSPLSKTLQEREKMLVPINTSASKVNVCVCIMLDDPAADISTEKSRSSKWYVDTRLGGRLGHNVWQTSVLGLEMEPNFIS